MDGIHIFVRAIGAGVYQVFIQNVNFPCDFIRIAEGFTLKDENPVVNHLLRRWILSPFQPGSDPIFVGELSKQNMAQLKVWYAFDACLRGPSRVTARLYCDMPAASKLPATIGREVTCRITDRPGEAELADYIESVRVNIKDRIEQLVERYAYSLNHPSAKEFQKALDGTIVIGEQHLRQLARLDFCDAYNSGATYQQLAEIDGDTAAEYYRWFVIDYGLPEPNGSPPVQRIKLPVPKATAKEPEQ